MYFAIPIRILRTYCHDFEKWVGRLTKYDGVVSTMSTKPLLLVKSLCGLLSNIPQIPCVLLKSLRDGVITMSR